LSKKHSAAKTIFLKNSLTGFLKNFSNFIITPVCHRDRHHWSVAALSREFLVFLYQESVFIFAGH